MHMTPATRRRWWLVLAIIAAVAPLLAHGATLAHTHDRGTPGLYNQEHDFTLHAVSSAAAALPEATPALVAIVVAVVLCVVLPGRPYRLVGAAADPRAPPAR